MVFPYGCIDLLFRKDVLINKNILNEIIETFKPGKTNIDDNLVMVRLAMSQQDANYEIAKLQSRYGLTHIKEGKAIDFLIINGIWGPEIDCEWVKMNHLKENYKKDGISHSKGAPFYEFVN